MFQLNQTVKQAKVLSVISEEEEKVEEVQAEVEEEEEEVEECLICAGDHHQRWWSASSGIPSAGLYILSPSSSLLQP